MARGRTVGRRPMPRRKFVWAREEYAAGTIINAETVLISRLLADFQSEYGANLIGATVMRLRGRLEFEPASAATAVGAVGVRVSSMAEAENATGDLMGPLEDQHADWMAYEPLIWNDNDPIRQVPRWEIDVKSNRKLEELGEELFLYVQQPIVGVTVTMRGIVSVGLKLP